MLLTINKKMEKIKAKDIFEVKNLDKQWKWITKDKYGVVELHTEMPLKTDCIFYNDFGDEYCLDNLFSEEIEFDSDDWKECCVERPVDYSKYIGKLGVFGFEERALNLEVGCIDILLDIIDKLEEKFQSVNGYFYTHFRPLTPEEIKELTSYEEE